MTPPADGARGDDAQAALAAALLRWQSAPPVTPGEPLDRVPFLIIDVNVTGIDPRSDRLLGVASCHLRGGRLSLRGLNEFSRSGADGTSGAAGPDADFAAALLQETCGTVLAGFNLPFAIHMIDRVLSPPSGVSLRQLAMVDLADALPALLPETGRRGATLQAWLRALDIPLSGEHDALMDGWAMAQAMLVVLDRAAARGVRTLAALTNLINPPSAYF